MSYPINYPTPQGANVQIFRGGDRSTTAHVATRAWVKPQGASFVWFTLIGAGGGGGGGVLDTSSSLLYYGGGGASGNVTNFMCPAFLIPDVLQVAVGRAGSGGEGATDGEPGSGSNGEPTKIIYQQKDGLGYDLLRASAGGGGTGAIYFSGTNGTGGSASLADTGGPMTAAGFYNATGGQDGKNGGSQATVNNLIYIMGGAGYRDNFGGTTTGYYGYVAQNPSGYSQISPIIMAIGGSNAPNIASRGALAAFGCGGNGGGDIASQATTDGSTGGDGLAIIVTW